jgi:hypothetical protein
VTGGWWLLDNVEGGLHVHWGRSAREAKTSAIAEIAASGLFGGMSVRAARRNAHSYHVRLVGGPLSKEDADRARAAWGRQDWETALESARPRARAAYGLPPRKRQEARHDEHQDQAARRRPEDRP